MADEEEASGGGKGPVTSWDVAKWIIPSFSALSILIGYIAKFAHHVFLGFDPGLVEPNEYLATTGDFLRWLAYLPASGFTSWGVAWFGGAHAIVVWLATVAAVAAIFYTVRLRKPGLACDEEEKRRVRFSIVAAIVVLLVLRILVMDGPVARLEGALIASEVSKPSGQQGEWSTQQMKLGARLGEEAKAGGPEGLIAERGQTLWNSIRCERPKASDAGDEQDDPAECTADQYKGVRDGEGLAQLFADVFLLALAACVLVDKPGAWRAAVAWVAVASCLFLPATFGKLGHSLEYDFAAFGLKTSYKFADDPAASPVKIRAPSAEPGHDAAPTPSADAGAATPPGGLDAQVAQRISDHTIQGVLLQSDKSWATVAVQETSGCATAVKIWRISNSEILWERDIFRTDVLSWSATKTGTSSAACPGPVASPHGNRLPQSAAQALQRPPAPSSNSKR